MQESAQPYLLKSWLRQHQALLFKVVRAYAFTPADQDDLFQEIVIQVWRSIPGFQEQHFENSMLSDLDHAITNVTYEIKRNKTFVWWFLLPTAIPLLLNLLQTGTPGWKWLVIPVAFVLAFAVTRWELNRKQLPRKRKLEALRDMLTKDEEIV